MVITEAMRRRTLVEGGGQPPQPAPVQAAAGPARSLRGQGVLTTGPPQLAPPVHRGLRHPQPARDLRNRHTLGEPSGRLPPHRLTLRPPPRGQPTCVGIPHPTGLRPSSAKITPTRRATVDKPGLSRSVAMHELVRGHLILERVDSRSAVAGRCCRSLVKRGDGATSISIGPVGRAVGVGRTGPDAVAGSPARAKGCPAIVWKCCPATG